MNPAPSTAARPSGLRPNPLIWECGAIREERFTDDVEGGGSALCATGVDVDAFIVVYFDLRAIYTHEQYGERQAEVCKFGVRIVATKLAHSVHQNVWSRVRV